MQTVKVGPTENGETVIESGLTPGQQVVVDGQYKLQPGSHVELTSAAGQPQKNDGRQRRAKSPHGEIASIREIVNISEPFIRRPVATSLLMVGVILLGLLGYKLLPISALPTVDFPTIEVTTLYPGASAGRDGLVGHHAARAAVRTDQRAGVDELDEFVWHLDHHAAIRTRSPDRCRRAGCAGGDQRRERLSADRPAESAEIQQGQSGRHADPHPRDHLGQSAARAGQRFCRHARSRKS